MNSKVLILGSFPSVKSREREFYYSHPSNRFFPVLYSIFNEQCSSNIDDRKEFLKRHNIALYDVIEKCDIEMSYDSSIKNVTPIDIKSILDRYPNISVIGVNGGTANKLFDKYIRDKIDTTKIKVVALPSTSSANARTSFSRLVECFYKLFE